MPRTAPRRQTPLRRPELVDAAREMIRTSGLAQLSLRKLANELGVTAPALYAHVQDKNDLIASVAAQGFDELVSAFDAVDASDPMDRLFEYSRCYVDMATSEPELFRVMFVFRPGAVPMPNIDNELPAATTAWENPGEAISEAIEAGRIHPDRDPLLTAMTLWTCTHGIASVLLLGQHDGELVLPENSTELINDAIHTMLAGLSLPPVPA